MSSYTVGLDLILSDELHFDTSGQGDAFIDDVPK